MSTKEDMSVSLDLKIAVVGLGYVGLPLAVAFGQRFRTIGYDSASHKILHYLAGRVPNGEISVEQLASANRLEFTNDPSNLRLADFVIIAVPTPVLDANVPDLRNLQDASRLVGENLQKGATVIFESTVYPGVTEEICIPLLEQASGLRWRDGFSVAYSPERINPGDHEHTLESVVKVVSGDSEETVSRVSSLYEEVVHAGVHRASSIKVAEASKVIENTQRDINIALVNELAIIFNKLGIDTKSVLEAAGTKWNFLPFRPGLVGGHCISVDPYYLTYKAESVGYHPQVILAGRRINDGMGRYVAEQTLKLMLRDAGISGLRGSRVNLLGVTFKEDCPDIRNSKAFDVLSELVGYGLEVFLHDPVADRIEVAEEYGAELSDWDSLPLADAIVVAVAHECFRNLSSKTVSSVLRPNGLVIDVKGCVDDEDLQAAGYRYWRL